VSEFGPGSHYGADPGPAEVSIGQTNDALGRVDDEHDEAVALLEQLEKAFDESPEEKREELHRQIVAADDRAMALLQQKNEAEQEHFQNVRFWDSPVEPDDDELDDDED